MSHPLDVPEFLLRKNHPEYNERDTGPRYLKKESREIVIPKTKAAPPPKEIGALTAREQEELMEIKAMVKTSLVHAKRMASDWVNRTAVREVQARRRHHLKTVKGLHRRA